MIPEYLDKNFMIYQHDAVTFLSSLSPESVQLIWTSPPFDADEQNSETLKTFAQMEATELCAAVADAAAVVLTSGGVLAFSLSHKSTDGVVAAVAKRTHLQFGGYIIDSSDLESTIVVFHKGEPNFYEDYLSTAMHDGMETIMSFIETNTEAGDIVVDPFCGSGRVMEAAVMTGRIAVVNDINPEAVASTINRYKERCAR